MHAPGLARRRAASLALAAALLALDASVATAQSKDTSQHHPPTVTIDVVGGNRVELGHSVLVRVTIDDVDGDLVDAKIVLAPPFLAMTPVRRAAPPVVREMYWFPDQARAGRNPIVVKAWESIGAAGSVTGRAELEVIGGQPNRLQLLDVDGDDRAEIVAAAPRADLSGPDFGAIALFHGLNAAAASHATSLLVPGTPVAGSLFGYYAPFLADLDHDGREDLLAATAANGGTIEVWYGTQGFQRQRASDAQLLATAPMYTGTPRWWYLQRDVTGDGIDDLITVAYGDSAVASNAGALFVFAGGARVTGSVAPTAVLRRATSFALDRLGEAGTVGVVVAEVTGDAYDDVIAVAPNADWAGGQIDRGVAVVFAGGPTLNGAVAPTAELRPPNATTPLRMGFHETGPGAWTVDLSGDGVRDVIVAAPKATGGGALYVWAGGTTLTGLPAPLATLSNANGWIGDELGVVMNGLGVHFADVTGDGQVDIVVGATRSDAPGSHDNGFVHVWEGGPSLSGTPVPTATLGITLVQASGLLAAGTNGLRVVDLTGDGIDDVMTIDPYYDLNGVVDVGAIHVWAGGAAMSGQPAPLATLFDPAETGPSLLGLPHVGLWQDGARLVDVTGDGVAELVVPATGATVGGTSKAGAIHLFAVGSAMAGSVAPFATLVAARPHFGDQIGACFNHTGPGLLIADLTGDRVPDVVAPAPRLSRQGHPECGGVLLWEGGANLAGTVLTRAQFFGTRTHGRIGDSAGTWQCADATGDAILDLVVVCPLEDDPLHIVAGRGVLLEGGPSLRGTVVPRAVLSFANPSDYDRLFSPYASIFRVLDLDGDGRDDVVSGSPWLNHHGKTEAGMVLWFPSCEPTASGFGAELFPPGFDDYDHFGGE